VAVQYFAVNHLQDNGNERRRQRMLRPVKMIARSAAKSWLMALCFAGLTVPAAGGGDDTGADGAIPKRFLLSGHSLTDDPFAEYLVAIGKTQGADMDWNEQIVIGSPNRVRTRGDSQRPGDWNGYSLGKNRDGREGLDILAELKRPTDRPFDTLIIAEGHTLVAQLIWNDTVRYVRHFHERMIEHNPATRSYLFEPWETLTDKTKPAQWIPLERDGTKLWRCVADRINISLKHEGRADRVRTIPVGAALADLVDAITRGEMPGLKPVGGREGVNLILADGVHLTQMGFYFAALVSYTTMVDRPITTSWWPRGVSEEAAQALQKFVADFHERRKATFVPLDMEGCSQLLVTSYCDAWNAYVPDEWSSPQMGCKPFFSRKTMALENENAPNPFVFSPEEDASYWFPAP